MSGGRNYVTADELRRIAENMDRLEHTVTGVERADLDLGRGDGRTVCISRETGYDSLVVEVAA